MKNKKLLLRLVNHLLKLAFPNNRLSEKNVLKHIKALKELSKGQAIFALNNYLKGLKQRLSEQTMIIETAVPLSKAQIMSIRKGFAYKAIVNPFLLGGIKVKIGDNVFDDTIKSRIEQVKEAISG